MTNGAVYLLIAMGFLTVGDHVTTNVFLKRGIPEWNPILAKVIARWGSTGLFIAKLALWGFVVVANHYYPIPILLLSIYCGVFAATIAWNLYQISEHQR